eukprot:TRINITY_DN8333_c0_g1_i3.p1 TRINITY_DN8333_c0_g1~~TRINITY_DN8333_c0_g1_i3.p1  ORF type:complete len:217 (+),score=26.96 TRINITY_DN8333_c0_g1_i3:103-753(+)
MCIRDRCWMLFGWLEGNRLGLCLLVRLSDNRTVLQVSDRDFEVQAREMSAAGLLEAMCLPRGYLSCVFRTEHGDIRLVNAHMNVGVVNAARIHQAREIVAQSRAWGQCTMLFVDSNSDARQPEMRYFSQEGWEDCWEGGLDTEGWTWSCKNPLTIHGLLQEPDQRCDFVMKIDAPTHNGLEGPRLVRQHAEIVLHQPPHTSDHFGVLATFALGSRN